MGADNWSVCPRCSLAAQERKARALTAANKAYGKVSAEDYDRILMKAKEMPDVLKVHDLGEFYELGVDVNGLFTVKYSCRCSQCDFEYAFKAQEGCRLGDSMEEVLAATGKMVQNNGD